MLSLLVKVDRRINMKQVLVSVIGMMVMFTLVACNNKSELDDELLVENLNADDMKVVSEINAESTLQSKWKSKRKVIFQNEL